METTWLWSLLVFLSVPLFVAMSSLVGTATDSKSGRELTWGVRLARLPQFSGVLAQAEMPKSQSKPQLRDGRCCCAVGPYSIPDMQRRQWSATYSYSAAGVQTTTSVSRRTLGRLG